MRQVEYKLVSLIADDGLMLTNGTSYSKEVYLGDCDEVDNWTEIPESEVPVNVEE